MEQIIITRPNSTTYPLRSKGSTASITSAVQNVALLGEDVVLINVSAAEPQHYNIGDKTTIFGRVYKLNRAPKVKKSGSRIFEYELEFEGVQYELARASYDLTIDTTSNALQDVQGDALIGNLNRFATVLVSNANRVMPGKWVLGDCPATVADKNLTFGEADNCLSVLQRLCQEFEIEFEIIQAPGGVNTIHFRKSGSIFPFNFEYGRGLGLYSLERQNVSEANIITRLKVYGANRNITNKYRANRLCLPGKAKGQSYIQESTAIDKFGVWEAVKYFEDVYPRRTGTVTALGSSVLKFVDSNMFDLNEKESDGVTTKYLLPGVSAKIHFNTGNLAGYEFDIESYDHATKTFTLSPYQDERGDVFPNENSAAFQLLGGEEYKLLDITLPQSYIDAAEAELEEKGQEYYEQNSQPKVQYSLSVTEDFLKKLAGIGSVANVFMVGDYIPVKDIDLGVDKSVRVKAFSRDLMREYNYNLQISDTVEASILNRVISQLTEVDRIVKVNNLSDPVQARANWRSSRELFNMVFDPEGDYYSEKIKPLSIDTLALSVGAKSMQFGLANTIIEANYLGNPNLIKVTGGVLTHYTIDPDAARDWYLIGGETTLTGGNSQAYYIYAKCSRSGPGGTIIFSTEQISVEQDAGWYHFWIGVVNSVDPELQVRNVSLTYGFTTINGRYIKTGRISSSGGSGSYFDLDENKFRIGTPSKGISWNEAGDGRLLLKGTLVQSGSGDTFPIGIFRGAYGAGVTYYKGDEVTYGGSTYRYINDAPTTGTLPTNTSYWTVVANKGADGLGDYFEYRYAKNGSSSAPPELIITDAVPDGWVTVTLPVSGSEYLWMSMAKKTSAGVLLSYWGPPVRVNTLAEQGEAGSSPVLVYCGEYSAGKTYYGNSNRLDAVKYSGLYYLARIDAGAFTGVLPTNTSKWNSFGANFESVATNLLLAEGANIGDWFMSGGKIVSTLGTANGTKKIFLDAVNNKIEMTEVGSTKKILIDANNSKIEVVALNYGISGQTDGSESSTIKIDAQTGVVEARNANGVSYISASGVFSNRPKTRTASPASGINQLGSIVGLGVANDSTSDLVAGVIGMAQNSGSAPAYGGWFKDLFANGLFAATRRIDASTGITIQDTMIVLYGGSSYSVTLPVVAQEGNVKFIKNIGTGTKTLYPGSGQDLYDDNSVNSSYSIENGRLIILHSVYVAGVMSWVITKMG